MATVPLALPALSDGVVRLRPFSERDAPALAAIWCDPEIRARNEVPEPSEDAGVALDQHVLGMLPEDLSSAPELRSGRRGQPRR